MKKIYSSFAKTSTYQRQNTIIMKYPYIKVDNTAQDGILQETVIPNFPLGPWVSKNRINSKKFIQVEVDVKCMQTNFGGPGLSSFGDFARFCLPSKQPNFPCFFL